MIILVAGLHGNESMPVKALGDKKIPFILGSPEALKKNKRFIDQDLNAAFGLRKKNYETKRAAEILKQISKSAQVVDFHTTTAKTPAFAIVVDEKMVDFAATTGLKHVVVMKHNIKKGHALINYRDGISIEAGNHGTQASYRTTLSVVRNVLKGKKYPIAVYEVFDIITKPGRYQNFKKHPDGFVPVLAGEKAYDFYGLKARQIK